MEGTVMAGVNNIYNLWPPEPQEADYNYVALKGDYIIILLLMLFQSKAETCILMELWDWENIENTEVLHKSFIKIFFYVLLDFSNSTLSQSWLSSIIGSVHGSMNLTLESFPWESPAKSMLCPAEN